MNERLVDLRQQRGLSRYAVARATGISDVSVKRFEDGVIPTHRGIRRQLALFYGVDVEWLFGIPADTRYCAVCGAEIADRRRFCSRECAAAHQGTKRHTPGTLLRAQIKAAERYTVPPSLPLPLPRIGERRMETPTIGGALPGEQPARACTVVQVCPLRDWYLVKFDRTGLYECYKVPNLDPQSRKIK